MCQGLFSHAHYGLNTKKKLKLQFEVPSHKHADTCIHREKAITPKNEMDLRLCFFLSKTTLLRIPKRINMLIRDIVQVISQTPNDTKHIINLQKCHIFNHFTSVLHSQGKFMGSAFCGHDVPQFCKVTSTSISKF